MISQANILVLFYSRDGSTAKMAELVAEGAARVAGINIRLRSIAEAAKEDLEWCHGLALGAPTHFGTIPSPMKKFWEDAGDLWLKLDGKIGCAFSSQGGWGGGAELTCQSLMTLMMNFGFLVFGLTDYSGPQFTAHYGAVQAGEPRLPKEREACLRLGQRLAEWVTVMVCGRQESHPANARYERTPQL